MANSKSHLWVGAGLSVSTVKPKQKAQVPDQHCQRSPRPRQEGLAGSQVYDTRLLVHHHSWLYLEDDDDGHWLNVMMQAPYSDDKADLPNGLYVMRTYTELKDGSRSVSVMLQNLTTQPIHLARGQVICQLTAPNAVPEAQFSPDLLKKLDDEDVDKPEPTKLSTQQRKDLLLAALQKDGGLDHLKKWLPELAWKVVALLLEFHNVFSLEPNKIGCTDAMEHVIELMKDEPFKEIFFRIAPPLVNEVHQHIQEMLDGGAIQPSQSSWCNAVVLVRKKDGSLWFCIDFRRLNARTKKDTYPLPRMQETMESMVGTWHFFCMDLKSGFWQVKMAEESSQYTAFTVGSMGVYTCPMDCVMLQQHFSISWKIVWGSWTLHMPWSTRTMWLSAPRLKKNTWSAFALH